MKPIIIFLFLLASFSFFDFSCEDDFDARLFGSPGTFILGFGGGDCASDCAIIFMLRDSMLFEYGPGLAPNLGPGAHILADWEVMDDQSRLEDVIALRDSVPQELLFGSGIQQFGCPGCTDEPFAQLGVFDESGFGLYSYINPIAASGSGVTDEVLEYGESIRELVTELGM